MKTRHCILCFAVTLAWAQTEPLTDDFYKYGPYDAVVYRDLRTALKEKDKVYRIELKHISYDSKVWDRFGELSQLMSVRLINNQLQSWPAGIEKCRYLCYLATYGNPLKEFLPALKNFSSLQYLDIQHSRTDSIPSGILYLRNLRVLKIGNTDDTLYFPKTLKYLKSLRELHLENLIPDPNIHRIFSIQGLQVLELSGLGLCRIPASIAKAAQMDVLILDNNQLTGLPWEIGLLKKLRILRLVNNKLEKLPDTLTELEELALLDLRGNPMPPEEIEKWKALLPGCEIKF